MEIREKEQRRRNCGEMNKGGGIDNVEKNGSEMDRRNEQWEN